MIHGGLLFGVSIVAGFVGAMTGMGGGVVLIPFLTCYGVDIKRAIAISLLSMVVISNSAATGFVRRHIPNLRVGAFLEVFAVLGSMVGAAVTVVSAPQPLFFLCGGLIVASGVMLWQRRSRWKPVTQPDAWSRALAFEGSYYDYAERHTITYQGQRAALSAPLMFGAGIVSGWLGVGGSAFTVLIHDLVIGLPPKVSLTTSNLIIGVMALAGASVYLEAGLINLKLAICVILGVPMGALLGSKLLVKLSNRVVRLVFLIVFFLLGLEMIVHGMQGVVR